MLPAYKPHTPCVVVYDLDDVLVQTQTAAVQAFAHCFAANLDITYDEAEHLTLNYFHQHGDSTRYMAERFGKDDAWIAKCQHDIHQRLIDQAAGFVMPDQPLRQQLEHAGAAGHTQAVLTFSQNNYAHHMLGLAGIRPLFVPELVLTHQCVEGHSKRTPEPYLRLLQRLTHVAASHPHIMVEDQPGNLKPAAQLGFTTVLVGEAARANTDGFIHARYPRVHDFLTAFLAGTFTPNLEHAA
ncbi:MAG TPA: HAD hydrolase-like protein [Alphaproteobacteria bacterium]|nr:HAD hydrolase-like protein [Alphaproteobacteria bacterium]